MTTFTPSPFPLETNRRLIAPYWTDIDTRNGGDIWYRESTNASLLQKASEELHEVFPEQHNFQASWMFIATWSDVAFYGADSTGRTKRCTFQCLLITNGRHSFTIFLYDKIEWTTGTASGGDSSTGLGGVPAQVGFDAGDGVNYFALEASRTSDIINVTQMSNVDIPGKFVFRVDYAAIQQGGCNINGTLTITPNAASMFGGTLLVISGPCFNQSENVKLVLSDVADVSCKILSSLSATCVFPEVYRTGKERVSLQVTGNPNEEFSFSGILTIVNHARIKPLIERYPTLWKHNQTVTIFWDPADLRFPQHSLVDINIYATQKNDNGSGITLKHYGYVETFDSTMLELGSYSFQLDFLLEACILKFSADDPHSPYYWSDMFTVNVNITHSQIICTKWIMEDTTLESINPEDVSACPCSLDVAILDTTRFQIDPLCKEKANAEYECLHQPYAMLCFKENVQSELGYDSQCCYDQDGVLMNSNGFYGSGYVNRYYFDGENSDITPFLSNFVNDIVPYHHCCLYPSQDYDSVNIHVFSTCSQFYVRRPPNSCMNYTPPVTARVSGDPHFATFDGHFYTFNPIGEFLAITTENFTLQLRMEQYGSSQGSSVTAFVAKPFPTADIIEVQTNSIRGIDVLINGELAELDLSLSNTINAIGSTITRQDNEDISVTVSFPGQQLSIQSYTALNILNLLVFISPDSDMGHLRGLFGNYDGIKENDLVTRSGQIVETNSSMQVLHNGFGLSWRISESESLFTYPSGRTYTSYQDPNFNPVVDIPDIIDPSLTEVCGSNEECIYDYYATGDRDLGQISANLSQRYEAISNITVVVASCGFPLNINNGVWTTNGYTEGSIATARCSTNYYPVEVTTTCTAGVWLPVNVSCVELPNCGLPQIVENGLWEADQENYGLSAVLSCRPGFYLQEIVHINCTTNGTWTNSTDFCIPECAPPYAVEHGDWFVHGYRNGSTAELLCDPGYGSPAVSIKCDELGQWEVKNITCDLGIVVGTAT